MNGSLRITRRGKIVVFLALVALSVLLNYLLRDWTPYGPMPL